MGPNENVTYNIGKGKGRYRNTVGFTKEGVQKPSPMRPPNKNKNKTHKAQMQVLKGKKSPMLCLEARIKKQLLKLLQATSAFSCLRVPGSGNGPCPWDPLTSIAWKGFSLSVPSTAPPSRAKTGQKYFKLQNFLFSLPPHPEWQIL